MRRYTTQNTRLLSDDSLESELSVFSQTPLNTSDFWVFISNFQLQTGVMRSKLWLRMLQEGVFVVVVVVLVVIFAAAAAAQSVCVGLGCYRSVADDSDSVHILAGPVSKHEPFHAAENVLGLGLWVHGVSLFHNILVLGSKTVPSSPEVRPCSYASSLFRVCAGLD